MIEHSIFLKRFFHCLRGWMIWTMKLNGQDLIPVVN